MTTTPTTRRRKKSTRSRSNGPAGSASYSNWETRKKPRSELLLFRLLNGGGRSLEADLRVRAVAEGFCGRAAAAAERSLLHGDLVPVHVGEPELALDDVRAVVF